MRNRRIVRWIAIHRVLLYRISQLLAVLVLAWVLSSAISSKGSQSAQTAELRGCRANNVLKKSFNTSNFASYQFFSGTALLLKKSLEAPRPGETKGDTEETRAYAKDLISKAGELQWVPTTRCVVVVYHQGHGPKAVFFSQRFPGPVDLNPSLVTVRRHKK